MGILSVGGGNADENFPILVNCGNAFNHPLGCFSDTIKENIFHVKSYSANFCCLSEVILKS